MSIVDMITSFGGDTLRSSKSGDSPRLYRYDMTRNLLFVRIFQDVLRDLSGFSGSHLPSDDNYLLVGNLIQNLLPILVDR